MADIFEFKSGTKVDPETGIEHEVKINQDAIDILEDALKRAKVGDLVAVGLVEVWGNKKETVTTSFTTGGNHYHQLNSGCALLFTRISSSD